MSHAWLRIVILAVGLLLASGSSPAGELKTTVAAVSESKLGAPCVAVHAGRLTHADLEVVLNDGTACPVLAGETKIGWFYSGRATFQYVSRDRIEYPVVRSNAKTEGRVSVKDIEGGFVAITGSIETVFFAASSGALPILEGGPAEAPAAAFGDHRATFKRFGGLSTAHVFAAATLDRWSTPAVIVELDGGDGPLIYRYEPTDARAESLELLAKHETGDEELRKELRSTALSDQPIGRDRRDPIPPPFAVSAVDYQMTAPGGDTVAVTARMTVQPVRPGIRVLRFEIPGRILVSSGPGNSSRRTYRIASVENGASEPLEFDQGNEDVIVDLGRPAAKGQAGDVVFHIEGNFLVRPNGDNYWILQGSEIFPLPELAGAQFTTHGVIRIKKPFLAFASGATVRREESGDDNVVEVRADLTSPHHAVVAGKYEFSEETREGLTVRVGTYAVHNARSQEQLTELAFGMIRHFERFLGSFPTPELNILQVNDLGWGQAPLGTMLITNEAFDRGLPPEIGHYYTAGINERFAHEIAHQWWGNSVHPSNGNETWISESFAEYCAGLMVKRAQEKGKYDNLKATWKLRGKKSSRVAPVALTDRISHRDSRTYWEDRLGLLYAKGPWLLSRLHEELGDEKFLSFLMSYQKSLRGKFGSTKLVEELLHVMTGKDYVPYFDANYWGTAMPN
jgi:hypothetical protein